MPKDAKRIAENVVRGMTASRMTSGFFEHPGMGMVTVWVKTVSSAEKLSLLDAGRLIGAANAEIASIMRFLDMKRGYMDYFEYVGAERDRVYGLSMRRFTLMEDSVYILEAKARLKRRMP